MNYFEEEIDMVKMFIVVDVVRKMEWWGGRSWGICDRGEDR